MVIRTQRVTTNGSDGQSSTQVQTKESKKPGSEFKQKVVESYKTTVKPAMKKAATKVKAAAIEAGNDLKEMVKK